MTNHQTQRGAQRAIGRHAVKRVLEQPLNRIIDLQHRTEPRSVVKNVGRVVPEIGFCRLARRLAGVQTKRVRPGRRSSQFDHHGLVVGRHRRGVDLDSPDALREPSADEEKIAGKRRVVPVGFVHAEGGRLRPVCVTQRPGIPPAAVCYRIDSRLRRSGARFRLKRLLNRNVLRCRTRKVEIAAQDGVGRVRLGLERRFRLVRARRRGGLRAGLRGGVRAGRAPAPGAGLASSTRGAWSSRAACRAPGRARSVRCTCAACWALRRRPAKAADGAAAAPPAGASRSGCRSAGAGRRRSIRPPRRRRRSRSRAAAASISRRLVARCAGHAVEALRNLLQAQHVEIGQRAGAVRRCAAR